MAQEKEDFDFHDDHRAVKINECPTGRPTHPGRAPCVCDTSAPAVRPIVDTPGHTRGSPIIGAARQ